VDIMTHKLVAGYGRFL